MPNTAPKISAAQASNQSGIPRRTLLAAIARGDLKAHKLGDATAAWIIDPADLADYLARREQASA